MVEFKRVLLSLITAAVFGAIEADDARMTLGVAEFCCEKVMLLAKPVGVVRLKVYVLPTGPGGIVKVIEVVEMDLTMRGRFLPPVLKDILL